MSEFHVEVVEIGPVERHPNADTLSITQIHGGYPVIFRTGEFVGGQLAVYVPVDSIVPDTEQWAFLKGHRRIKAKRLRGIFSMGMLAPLPSVVSLPGTGQVHWNKGDNVQEAMGIEKYEPVVHAGKLSYAENEPDQAFMPKYTDIEGWRRNRDVIKKGEQVVLTEKLHGANGRWLHHEGRFWVGSHNYLKKQDPSDIWWRCLDIPELCHAVETNPGFVFYGEVLGVQDLKYGASKDKPQIRVFDILDIEGGKYVDYTTMREMCENSNLECCPPIFIGEWHDGLVDLAEGKSLMADHVREGFVVKPLKERWDRSVGRVILKVVGEGYLLRKEG